MKSMKPTLKKSPISGESLLKKWPRLKKLLSKRLLLRELLANMRPPEKELH
jgi:hypothetical protein